MKISRTIPGQNSGALTEMKASPQTEDGYTRVANELLEAILGYKFTQRQLLVVFAVIRKTYGYGKKTDDMSAAQLGAICGMQRNHVTEVIGQLVQMNVLTRAPGSYGLVLGLNKAHNHWSYVPASPKLVLVPIQDKTSPDLGQVGSPKLGHTKENLPKEKQKKVPRAEKSFQEWIADCQQLEIKPIPEDDPAILYGLELGMPEDYIRYAWVEFRRKFSLPGSKKYKNWNQHFQNAVRENWFKIWFQDESNSWLLTTRGKQIEAELKAKKKND